MLKINSSMRSPNDTDPGGSWNETQTDQLTLKHGSIIHVLIIFLVNYSEISIAKKAGPVDKKVLN